MTVWPEMTRLSAIDIWPPWSALASTASTIARRRARVSQVKPASTSPPSGSTRNCSGVRAERLLRLVRVGSANRRCCSVRAIAPSATVKRPAAPPTMMASTMNQASLARNRRLRRANRDRAKRLGLRVMQRRFAPGATTRQDPVEGPDMKRGCRVRRPGNLLTWSAAGCSSPGDHANRSFDRRQRCLGENTPRRHPDKASGASPERTEPTPLLNHETSDHLLSHC